MHAMSTETTTDTLNDPDKTSLTEETPDIYIQSNLYPRRKLRAGQLWLLPPFCDSRARPWGQLDTPQRGARKHFIAGGLPVFISFFIPVAMAVTMPVALLLPVAIPARVLMPFVFAPLAAPPTLDGNPAPRIIIPVGVVVRRGGGSSSHVDMNSSIGLTAGKQQPRRKDSGSKNKRTECTHSRTSSIPRPTAHEVLRPVCYESNQASQANIRTCENTLVRNCCAPSS